MFRFFVCKCSAATTLAAGVRCVPPTHNLKPIPCEQRENKLHFIMNKLNFFAALCCAALLFAACDKDCKPTNPTGYENNHGYVDLGLSVKWATCNVGATSPEAYGNYYAWGETKTKSDYSWDTYKYGSAYTALTKYCSNRSYRTVDNLTTLEASDDAAAANWGGAWRMPTDAEWTELREKCTWTWTSNYNGTGVAGYEVKASNGNSIFLPAAGYRGSDGLNYAGSGGDYWSSSLDTDYPDSAWDVGFLSDYVYGYNFDRYCGHSVRPVFK